MIRSLRYWQVILLCIGMISGCASDPEPPPPPVRTEAPPPPVAPPAPLDDEATGPLINRSVQVISNDLLKVPAVRDTKHRLVFMASTDDQSASARSDESSRVLRQLLTKLAQDKAFSRLFRVVNAPATDPEKLNEALGGSSADDRLLPDSDEEIGPVANDPRDVYLLSAVLTEQDRYNEYRSTLSLRIEHPHTRQTVLAKDLKLNLSWDPDRRQWLEIR